MKPRKIPMRMCVGCRTMFPKKELVRVVRSNQGAINADRTGKLPGRGAYICANVDCLHKAMKTKALERALEHKFSLELYDQLDREIARREL